MLTAELDGAEVQSIEGLAEGGKPWDPVQESFMEKGAVQCGFCTPGMIMTAKGLLNRNPNPDKKRYHSVHKFPICAVAPDTKKILEAVDAGFMLREIKDPREQTKRGLGPSYQNPY